ncbi:MAG: S8 family serine peptidase [Pseudomonadota bacterium]
MAAEIENRYDVNVAAEWPLGAIAVHCFVVDASSSSDIDGLITEMQADALIRTVQRMQEFEILGQDYLDPFFPAQYALKEMNVVKAHARSTGSGIRVGVVDSAVDVMHPDLVGRLVETKDFVSQSEKRTAEAHGTAIAGLIAANADKLGMVGVAPGASIVGLRACWQRAGKGGRCSSFSLARALNFAVINQIDVLNLSLGGPPDPLLQELIETATSNGMVIVAALGESETPAFPASMPDVIAAGRRDFGGIAAPATDVISTAPEGQYRYVSGSSVAAAHVSGVVVLLLAKRNDLTPSAVTQTLIRAQRNKGDGPVLDAFEALELIED